MRIWTKTTYEDLYGQAALRYGPINKVWESATRPGRGLNADYKAFLTTFAEVCGAKSAKAVELQIKRLSYPVGRCDRSANCVRLAAKAGLFAGSA